MDNLPTPAGVTTAPAVIALDRPAVTTTTAVDSWTVHLGPVTATVRYAYGDENWSVVYVDDAVAESVDPLLAALAKLERELGDDRNLSRGIDENIDGLYDRLNGQMATVKAGIAAAVLPLLGDVLDNHPRLLDKVEFSPYGGCASCKCSPGVKAPYARKYGEYVQVSIGPAR